MKPFSILLVLIFHFNLIAQNADYEKYVKKEVISNTIENSDSALNQPYVIMVSIDGFRYDYAQKYNAKNILSLAENGSSTTRLIPSFPSKTFPNHYTLVTGLYPQNHGIVSNSFYDKSTQKRYSIGNRNAVENGDWYNGIPLWNLAQKQGMCAASYFWVGSEADINGLHPKYYYKFDKNTPYEYRVKRVLEWLEMPEKVRPHMITLYFSTVDTNGHKFGPDAQQTKEAVLYVDEQIGTLREGLEKSKLPVYLIITSDHGMDDVSKLINISEYISIEKEQFFAGPVAMIYTKNKAETDTLYNQLSQQKLFKVYRREQVPNYLNYNKNQKVGDLVLIADAPYTLIYSETQKSEKEKPGGTHGYDPYENKNMGGIFYIEGPSIKKNYQLSPIENIQLYPLVAHLLGLEINTPIDGNLDATISVIQEN